MNIRYTTSYAATPPKRKPIGVKRIVRGADGIVWMELQVTEEQAAEVHSLLTRPQIGISQSYKPDISQMKRG